MRQATFKMPIQFSPLPQYESLTGKLFTFKNAYSFYSSVLILRSIKQKRAVGRYWLSPCTHLLSVGRSLLSASTLLPSVGRYWSSARTHFLFVGHYLLSASTHLLSVNRSLLSACTLLWSVGRSLLSVAVFSHVGNIKAINTLSLFPPIAQSSDLLNAPHNLLPT